jgi:hypothetical protein
VIIIWEIREKSGGSSVGHSVCLVSERKLNLSRCSGCAYESRAILDLLQSCTQAAYSKGTSDGYAFAYYFLRSAVRINDLLHLRSSNPAYGRLPNPVSQVGVDLAFAISTIGLAVILLLFLRSLLRARSLAVIANPIAGFLAIQPLREPSGAER